jgi:thiamine biosynthesis lipoprotein
MKANALPNRRAALGVGLGAFAWLAAGCSERRGLEVLAARGEHAFGGLSMGTRYNVKIATPGLGEATMTRAKSAVATALAEVVARMSHYDAGSELSLLNRQAVGRPAPVSAPLLQVLQAAQAVHAASAGAFDVALGDAVQAWGFGPAPPARRLPDPQRLRTLRRTPGSVAVELDARAGTIRRHAPVSLNLSGIAKGFGVDRAALALQRLGIDDFMVEVGGEIRTQGRNDRGQPWQLAIERPDAMPQRALRLLPLQGKALATSGDYRNYFMHEGRRYSHEIDPTSATPVSHALASVSVVADDCMQADAWSTALFVLGPRRGYALAESLGLAAYFVLRQGGDRFDERPTPAFAALGSQYVEMAA